MEKRDVAEVGAGAVDDSIQDSRKERRREPGTKGAVLGQFLDLCVKGCTHSHGLLQRLSSFKPHGAGALEHGLGLLQAILGILNAVDRGVLSHGVRCRKRLQVIYDTRRWCLRAIATRPYVL